MKAKRTLGRYALLAGATAVCTATVGEPIRRILASRGTFDIPNHRSSHNQPVVRGGGLAPILGASAVAALSGDPVRARTTTGVLALAALGGADDIAGGIAAPARLLSQIVLGACNFSADSRDAPLAAFTTSGIVNVVNFMDGINGITSLTGIVWGSNAVLCASEDDGHLATLGALTAGGCLGFLPHNLPTAKMFLGDIGSYAVGATIAAGVLGQGSFASRFRVAAPLLPYAFDAGQALIRRSRRGEPLTEAHRDHVYQALVDSGYSHAQVAAYHATIATLVAASTRLPRVPATLSIALLLALYLGTTSAVRYEEGRNDPSQTVTYREA